MCTTKASPQITMLKPKCDSQSAGIQMNFAVQQTMQLFLPNLCQLCDEVKVTQGPFSFPSWSPPPRKKKKWGPAPPIGRRGVCTPFSSPPFLFAQDKRKSIFPGKEREEKGGGGPFPSFLLCPLRVFNEGCGPGWAGGPTPTTAHFSRLHKKEKEDLFFQPCTTQSNFFAVFLHFLPPQHAQCLESRLRSCFRDCAGGDNWPICSKSSDICWVCAAQETQDT